MSYMEQKAQEQLEGGLHTYEAMASRIEFLEQSLIAMTRGSVEDLRERLHKQFRNRGYVTNGQASDQAHDVLVILGLAEPDEDDDE